MREILFKAKTIDSGEWAEGSLVVLSESDYRIVTNDNARYAYTSGSIYDGDMIEVDVSTICQYTGLTDKNGNKIWENDIVERVDRRNGIYIFREQPKMNCRVVWTDRHGFDTSPSCGYFDKKGALECEVIGNIFDNPELLKGE